MGGIPELPIGLATLPSEQPAGLPVTGPGSLFDDRLLPTIAAPDSTDCSLRARAAAAFEGVSVLRSGQLCVDHDSFGVRPDAAARCAAPAFDTLNSTLAELTDDEIDLLRDGTTVERGYLMWVAACRRYGLLGEFAEEVVRERFLLLAPAIGHADFDSFIRSKAMWHEELAELKESTYRKLRSNVFLMLHEVGVLDDAGNITPAVLTDRLTAALGERSPSDVRFLPTNEPVTSRSGR